MSVGRKYFPEDIKRLVSHKSKERGDFKRQREILDIFDSYYGGFRDNKKNTKIDINSDLFNGRLDLELYDAPLSLKIGSEQVVLDQNVITHYPFIAQVARALHGEQISRPFSPTAIDMGPIAQTTRKKKMNELIREMITGHITGPIQEKAYKEFLQANNVQDVRQLSPEQQQQMQAEIQQTSQSRTPSEIIDFMENDYATPTQRAAQQMLDWCVDFLDIKSKQDNGFRDAITIGEEIYYVGERNGDVCFDLINPKHFQWGGSQDTIWYQEGDWAKHESWHSVSSALQRNAMTLGKKDIKDLENYLEPFGGAKSGTGHYDPVQWKVMYDLSDSRNPERIKYENLNIGTKEGQSELKKLYGKVISNYGSDYGTSFSDYGIRESHIVWRDKRKLRYVTRRDKEGNPMGFWMDEYYEEKPKDIEIKDIWVDEIWEGTKIGSNIDPIYTNIRPLPAQYKSVFDPFRVELPYYGRQYENQHNNSRNISPIDLGKPFQKEIDATMANIRHDMSTDVGKVLMMQMSLKPEKWTWQEWLSTMKMAKIVPTNADQHGSNPVEQQLNRAIDMSRTSDIVNKLTYLQSLEQNLIKAMLFNQSRIGAIGQYATQTTTQTNQVASYNQTEGFFDTHRQIIEKALNGLINRAKQIYKDKPHRLEVILDDVARMDLKVSEDFWYEASGVKISLSSEDIRAVENLKQLSLTLAQNNMSMEGLLQLSLAKTPSDVISIFKTETRKTNEQQQAAQQSAMEAQQAEFQRKMEETMQAQQFEAGENEKERKSKEARAMMESQQFARSADINENNVADSVEKEKVKMIVTADKNAKDHEIALEELKLKEREIIVKEKLAQESKK